MIVIVEYVIISIKIFVYVQLYGSQTLFIVDVSY